MYYRADIKEERLLSTVRDIMNICGIEEATDDMQYKFAVCDEHSAENYAGRVVTVVLYREENSTVRELSGADDVILLKVPFKLERLMYVISEYRRSIGGSTETFELYGESEGVDGEGKCMLIIDPKARRLSCNGAEIMLTSREYALFDHLYMNLGEVVSREELMQSVWRKSSGSNIVDVYICYLRQKLVELIPSVTLTAVRGSGYMLKF